MTLRAIFFGTPDFAAKILDLVAESKACEIVRVYTQPDRPAGRKRKLQESAVKKLAQGLKIPVFQPEALNDDVLRDLKQASSDLLLVAAYGLLLPEGFLNLAYWGAINVHASLLPKYRGAAPIQRALINGERASGITIMQMQKGLDAGPILLQRALAIGIEDTALSLQEQLAELGGELLVQALERLPKKEIYPIKQDESLATYAPKLRKEEGEIDWSLSAWDVHNLVRGVYPWPGAYFFLQGPKEGKRFKVQAMPGKLGPEIDNDYKPGEILGLSEDDELMLACADRAYLIPKLKPAGSKEQKAREFYCGYIKGKK